MKTSRRKFLFSIFGVPFVGCAMPKVRQVPVPKHILTMETMESLHADLRQPRFKVTERTECGSMTSLKYERVHPFGDNQTINPDWKNAELVQDGYYMNGGSLRVRVIDREGYFDGEKEEND